MVSVTFIIPVYNSERYIKDCIMSIINQSCNIEIIIIDDGSTDNSLNICEKLKNKYSCIKLVKQRNKGPGAARNIGLEKSTGKYITFLDADDYIPKGIIKKINKIVNKEDVDIFIGNIFCFDSNREWHIPYMKDVFCNKDNIGDLKSLPNIVKTASVCNKWFKGELIRNNNILFDENVKVGEDFLFVQEAYLKSKKILIKDIDIYAYRLIKNDSLIKKSEINFFNDIYTTQKKLADLFKEKEILGEKSFIRQIEFFIDSIFLKINELDEKYYEELVDIGIEILKCNKEIKINKTDFRTLERYFLAFLFSKSDKANLLRFIKIVLIDKVPKEVILIEKTNYSYMAKYFIEYIDILKIEPIIEAKVEDVELKDNRMVIRGYSFVRGIDYSSNETLKPSIVIKGMNSTNIIKKTLEVDLRTDITYLFKGDGINYNWTGYKPIIIELDKLNDDNYDLYIEMIINNCKYTSKLSLKLAEIRNKLKVRYLDNNREVFCRFQNGEFLQLRIRTLKNLQLMKSKLRLFKRNSRYDLGLIKSRKYKAFITLLLYRMLEKKLRNKEYWLMGEREDTAQDNTFHLFKFINNNKMNINNRYVILKKSEDLKYIKKYGNIVWFNSIKHTLLLLTCKYTINSYSERANMYTKEYLDIVKYYPEFKKNKKIFLQHGVIGVSRVNHVLHKNRMGYDLFIVSSQFEKDHIVKEFGYSEDEVKVIGLTRWDNLNNKANKKKILIMPSWRAWIKSEEELEKSEYFKRFIDLLTNKKFIKSLNDNDYEVTFYPHYQTQRLLNNIDVNFDKRIKVVKQGEKTVQELINENYLLITDYSTVAFDFAYSDKPVIFYQFDYNEFYSKHYNEGPINHKKDLFGHRVETENELIDIIVRSDFKSKNFYKKNIYIKKLNNGSICNATVRKIIEIG